MTNNAIKYLTTSLLTISIILIILNFGRIITISWLSATPGYDQSYAYSIYKQSLMLLIVSILLFIVAAASRWHFARKQKKARKE